MASHIIIGHPSPRVEGMDKVTGAAQYTADVTLPSTLWGCALRSPFPHARIVHIDASQAQQGGVFPGTTHRPSRQNGHGLQRGVCRR
jgi:CO/xanthine dehydrogenase Mo-binding subunit